MLFAALHSKRLFLANKDCLELIALETICVRKTIEIEILQLKEFAPIIDV